MSSAQYTNQLKIRVSELFTSIQGEGPFTGSRAVFIRLAGCNLRCYFCDTKYSQDPSSGEVVELKKLVEFIEAEKPQMVVITGGEPLLQKKSILELAKILGDKILVQVETNGTIPPPSSIPSNMVFVVSPKNIPVEVENAILRIEWIELSKKDRVWFKFLAASRYDVARIRDYVLENNIPLEKVYVMPLTREDMELRELVELHREIARAALSAGLGFSPRLHLILELK